MSNKCQQHTAEPWKVEGDVVIYGNGDLITVTTRDYHDKTGEADARRIVACVNACAGIDTAALESTKTGELLELVTWKIDQVTKQRDELLAALSALLECQSIERLRGHTGLMDMIVTGEDVAAGLKAIANAT